jgi:hypothetical protein
MNCVIARIKRKSMMDLKLDELYLLLMQYEWAVEARCNAVCDKDYDQLVDEVEYAQQRLIRFVKIMVG